MYHHLHICHILCVNLKLSIIRERPVSTKRDKSLLYLQDKSLIVRVCGTKVKVAVAYDLSEFKSSRSESRSIIPQNSKQKVVGVKIKLTTSKTFYCHNIAVFAKYYIQSLQLFFAL